MTSWDDDQPAMRSGERQPVDEARTQAVHRRDAALNRIGITRRWVVTGAAGLSAGFAALVYALAPGHSLSSARAATAPAGTAGALPASRSAMPAPAGPSALGLSGGAGGSGRASGQSSSSPAPAQSAPAPATSAPAPSNPPVTSGGS